MSEQQPYEHHKIEEPFEKIDIPRKELPQTRLSRYRVYRDAGNYTVIEAENALEALRISGLKQAFRIMRDALYFINVLKTEAFVSATPPVMNAPENSVETPPVVEKTSAAPVAVPAETPLSDSDVDRLLQGS